MSQGRAEKHCKGDSFLPDLGTNLKYFQKNTGEVESKKIRQGEKKKMLWLNELHT